MFASKNQFYVFAACIAFGIFVGIVLGISNLIKHFIKNRFIKIIPDIIFISISSFAFLCFSYYLSFPNIRLYMFLGIILGCLGYFKSFHIILAKYLKKFYNIIIKNKIERKKTKDERIKNKKNDSCGDGWGNSTSNRAFCYNDISNDSHKG